MKVFLVVGMHRSATSLVAKGLHDCGVPMGDSLIGCSPSNPWGHFEDFSAVKINDHILEKAGGSWREPPPHEAIEATYAPNLDRYLRHRKATVWGLKDPRLSLTWPVWLPRLADADVHVVWVRRRREQVARSLARRDGTTVDEGIALAGEYERRTAMLMEAVA